MCFVNYYSYVNFITPYDLAKGLASEEYFLNIH